MGRVISRIPFGIEGTIMDTPTLSERWHLRLKNEVLHRNANSRADCLVELLIRAVEDLAHYNEIKDRRRQVVGKIASFRTQQTSKQHPSALQLYKRNPQKISETSSITWDIEGKKTRGENVHCPLCGVCPYTWLCSCLENRAGIPCVHWHAVIELNGPQHRVENWLPLHGL
ncbi:hypothetical protein COOONC_20325 [Cooperia oncophora]